MKVDILIRNGHVIDPARGIDRVMDVASVYNRMVDMTGVEVEAARVVDASGCYVTPGLIDFHSHLFYDGNRLGTRPDYYLPMGVTAAGDGGSAGWVNFPAFYRDVISTSQVKVKAYLAFCNYGVVNEPESCEPEDVFPEQIRRMVRRYPDVILGIKLRTVPKWFRTTKPLEDALALAEELGIGVCIHVQGSIVPMDDIARLLRPGDIFCHVYHGTGQIIIDGDNRVTPEVRRARERGVLFDMCSGGLNFAFPTARAALADGFPPDIISSDNTNDKIHQNQVVRSLPYVMSKMLELGMGLEEVIRCVTATPARAMRMEGQIGTLAPGAHADIAIFKLEDIRALTTDSLGNELVVNRLFMPRMTISSGEFVYAREDFNLVPPR